MNSIVNMNFKYLYKTLNDRRTISMAECIVRIAAGNLPKLSIQESNVSDTIIIAFSDPIIAYMENKLYFYNGIDNNGRFSYDISTSNTNNLITLLSKFNIEKCVDCCYDIINKNMEEIKNG